MKPEVLLVTPMMPHVEAALDDAYRVHRLFEAADTGGDRAALLAEAGPGVRGAATMGQASAELIDALPALEIISSFGVGYDGVNVARAAERKIIVTNTPDVLNDEVANLAVMFLLNTSRRFVEWERFTREGRWEREGDPPLARAVRGRQIGILGLGRIGKDIARKLEIFGCKIAYHGRGAQPDQPYRFYAELTEMARDSDFLIAICPGGAATRDLVNREVIEALGPEGTFINVSRGSVHDEDALIAALRDGRLGAAGLDVFADEPRVPQALLELDNVVLQPHQGSATVETRKAMGDLVVDNLAAHFAGREVLTRVV